MPSRKKKKNSTISRNSPPSAEPLDLAEDSERRHAAIGNQYARDVLAGRILGCKWVKLACQRHLDDFERANSSDFPFAFDEAKAGRICRFIEQLPHTKGDWAIQGPGRDNRIKLEPWQCFIYSCVFGWVHKSTGLRRFRIAYICVPRKNGKSIIAAGTGNYMFASDGEFGAEVYAGATCKRQAWEVFRPAKLMVQRTPRLKQVYGIDVGAANLHILENGSRFEPLVGNPGDGASPSCAIVDEYHEHRTDALVDAMRTGMGARKQPLLWIITTAGDNIAGPCHMLQREVEKVLEGSIERDELFGIVYTIDAEEDWTTEQALIKANPNYGISVSAEFLRSEQSAAVQNSAKQGVFQTKHLNVWVGSNHPWMNMQRWKAQADPTLSSEQFLGLPCFMAADLASKLDLTALVKVFRREIDKKDHFYAFSRFFLPAERAKDPDCQHYQKWVHEGHILTTPGNVIDYDFIGEQAIADINECQVIEFGFDPWNATQFSQSLAKVTSAQMVEIPQQTRYLSEPMKQLEALVIDGRIHHDGNPVLMWMMSNVVAHKDAKENIFPNKEKAESKIDGAVALIMALSRALVGGSEPGPFEPFFI